jgi:hypothetical protein
VNLASASAALPVQGVDAKKSARRFGGGHCSHWQPATGSRQPARPAGAPGWTHIRLTPLTLKKFQLVCFWATITPRPRRDHLLHTFRDVSPIDMEVLELLSDFALVPRPTEAEKEAVG